MAPLPQGQPWQLQRRHCGTPPKGAALAGPYLSTNLSTGQGFGKKPAIKIHHAQESLQILESVQPRKIIKN
jgi:hypothetical protein